MNKPTETEARELLGRAGKAAAKARTVRPTTMKSGCNWVSSVDGKDYAILQRTMQGTGRMTVRVEEKDSTARSYRGGEQAEFPKDPTTHTYQIDDEGVREFIEVLRSRSAKG